MTETDKGKKAKSPPPFSSIWGPYKSPSRKSIRVNTSMGSTTSASGLTPGRRQNFKPEEIVTSTPAQVNSSVNDSGMFSQSISCLSSKNIRDEQHELTSDLETENDSNYTTKSINYSPILPNTISPFRFQGFEDELHTPNDKKTEIDGVGSSKLGPAILEGLDVGFETPTKQQKIETVQEFGLSELDNSQDMLEKPTEILCPRCGDIYTEAKVLACFHSFCTKCLSMDDNGIVICSECQTITQLDESVGMKQLITDYGLENYIKYYYGRVKALSEESNCSSNKSNLENLAMSASDGDDDIEKAARTFYQTKPPPCTTCTSVSPSLKKSVVPAPPAVARCRTCVALLCQRCKKAHFSHDQYLGHVVTSINSEPDVQHRVKCTKHDKFLEFVCMPCNQPACEICLSIEHNDSHHSHMNVKDMASNCFDYLVCYMNLAQHKEARVSQLRQFAIEFEATIEAAYVKCVQDIENDHQRLLDNLTAEKKSQLSLVEETKLRSLDDVRQFRGRLDCYIPKLRHTLTFTNRLLRYGAKAQVAIFKELLEKRYNTILRVSLPEMITNLHYAATLIYKANSSAEVHRLLIKALGKAEIETLHQMATYPFYESLLQCVCLERKSRNFWPQISPMKKQEHEKNDIETFDNLVDNLYSMPRNDNSSDVLPLNKSRCHSNTPISPMQCPSKLSADILYQLASNEKNLDKYTLVSNSYLEELARSQQNYYAPSTAGMMPKSANVQRHKMIYHLRFGEYGSDEGKFTEPSGVAVGNSPNNRFIYVADTNNHRIQAFARDGQFQYSFGECGKRDGQLLYPNRVTVCSITGQIIVTERAPTHQIQVFSPSGQFVRKFGAYVLQHPRGVCVDNHQRIVVVECKVMRILIFSMEGQVLKKICCRPHLEFPNGVCTNEHEEIFISDNRAHAVKVFNYEGSLLRLIGGEGITNYPIGVGINIYGQVVVADNHNNFNVTTFTQEGKFLQAFESKLKHAQCFDVALTDEGSVVLASKDFKIYLYRYESTSLGDPNSSEDQGDTLNLIELSAIDSPLAINDTLILPPLQQSYAVSQPYTMQQQIRHTSYNANFKNIPPLIGNQQSPTSENHQSFQQARNVIVNQNSQQSFAQPQIPLQLSRTKVPYHKSMSNRPTSTPAKHHFTDKNQPQQSLANGGWPPSLLISAAPTPTYASNQTQLGNYQGAFNHYHQYDYPPPTVLPAILSQPPPNHMQAPGVQQIPFPFVPPPLADDQSQLAKHQQKYYHTNSPVQQQPQHSRSITPDGRSQYTIDSNLNEPGQVQSSANYYMHPTNTLQLNQMGLPPHYQSPH